MPLSRGQPEFSTTNVKTAGSLYFSFCVCPGRIRQVQAANLRNFIETIDFTDIHEGMDLLKSIKELILSEIR